MASVVLPHHAKPKQRTDVPLRFGLSVRFRPCFRGIVHRMGSSTRSACHAAPQHVNYR